jgi:hypothetical protein
MHPNVVKSCEKEMDMKTFLFDLIKSYIYEKHKIEVAGGKNNIFILKFC